MTESPSGSTQATESTRTSTAPSATTARGTTRGAASSHPSTGPPTLADLTAAATRLKQHIKTRLRDGKFDNRWGKNTRDRANYSSVWMRMNRVDGMFDWLSAEEQAKITGSTRSVSSLGDRSTPKSAVESFNSIWGNTGVNESNIGTFMSSMDSLRDAMNSDHEAFLRKKRMMKAAETASKFRTHSEPSRPAQTTAMASRATDARFRRGKKRDTRRRAGGRRVEESRVDTESQSRWNGLQ